MIGCVTRVIAWLFRSLFSLPLGWLLDCWTHGSVDRYVALICLDLLELICFDLIGRSLDRLIERFDCVIDFLVDGLGACFVWWT